MSRREEERRLRSWAEHAVQSGLSVIALHAVYFNPIASCGCWKGVACPRIGKHPRGGKGWQDRGITDERSARLLALGDVGGIGVLTGSASGVVVIDVDPRNGGETSLEALQVRRGPLPATRTALSGRNDGGRHLYYAIPRDIKVRSSSRIFGEGIDVLSDGRFVVAPPSKHAMGGRYTFDPNAPMAIGALPFDLLELLAERPRFAPTPAERAALLPVGDQRMFVAVMLRDACERVAKAREGGRNITLNVEAYLIGSLIAKGYLDPEDVLWELVTAATVAGLSGNAAFATACSGLGDGADDTLEGSGTAIDDVARRARRDR